MQVKILTLQAVRQDDFQAFEAPHSLILSILIGSLTLFEDNP